ncbi:MAG TPA: prolyl oligopeptidase family serine peptidase, partial [Gemmataceae bacterium]|nr:prolyl oligopeptidase family serine peptidase [Gemmataceae bacterium]
MMRNVPRLILAAGALVLILGAGTGARAGTKANVTLLHTPDGIEFGLLGDKPKAPAPTLFVFANDIRGTLADFTHYNKVGSLLARQGFLSVSLDLPCHGKDNKEKVTNALAGWRKRLEAGDDLVPGFTAKCTRVLDYLVREGYTDPGRVAACGTSRGGFMALHFAAADPRVRCVVGLAPVTDLLALTEFRGMEKSAAVNALALARVADKLAGRPVWVTIGNNDGRVGTDKVIAFTRDLVRASVARKEPPRVELHVLTNAGHSVHPAAHAEAAAWVAACL